MTDTTTPSSSPELTEVSQDTPVVAPALPYTVRANLREYRRRLGVLPIGLAVIILGVVFGRFGIWAGVGITIATAGLIAGILAVLGKRALMVRKTGLELRVPLRRIRQVALQDIEDVKVFMNYIEGTFGPVPRVSIAVRGQGPLILNSLYWPLEDLDNLLAILRDKNIKIEYYADPANYTLIAKQFPTHATLLERHPWRIAWGVVLAIAVLVTLTVIGFEFWW